VLAGGKFVNNSLEHAPDDDVTISVNPLPVDRSSLAVWVLWQLAYCS